MTKSDLSQIIVEKTQYYNSLCGITHTEGYIKKNLNSLTKEEMLRKIEYLDDAIHSVEYKKKEKAFKESEHGINFHMMQEEKLKPYETTCSNILEGVSNFLNEQFQDCGVLANAYGCMIQFNSIETGRTICELHNDWKFSSHSESFSVIIPSINESLVSTELSTKLKFFGRIESIKDSMNEYLVNSYKEYMKAWCEQYEYEKKLNEDWKVEVLRWEPKEK